MENDFAFRMAWHVYVMWDTSIFSSRVRDRIEWSGDQYFQFFFYKTLEIIVSCYKFVKFWNASVDVKWDKWLIMTTIYLSTIQDVIYINIKFELQGRLN